MSTNTLGSFKLAPSPRDRSFRSQDSSRRALSPRKAALIERRGSRGSKASVKGSPEEDSPEMSAKVVSEKKRVTPLSLPLSPRSKTSPPASPRKQQQQQAQAATPAAADAGPGNPISPTAKSIATAKASGAAAVDPTPTSSYSAAPTTAVDPPGTSVAAPSSSANPTSPSDPTPPANNNAPSRPAAGRPAMATTRSKRMLVVDPKSGKKVYLHADDHSLTDKELYVYHKKGSKGKAKREEAARQKEEGAAGNRARALSEESASESTQHTAETATQNTLNTLGTDDHTLETASALTEVSYYGRYKLHSGPLQCIIPTSCRSFEQMALGDLMYAGADLEKQREARDDVESVERARFKHLLEEEDENGDKGNSPKRGLKVDTDANNEGEGAVMSPLAGALTSLVSPRTINTLTKSFFGASSPKAMSPDNSEVVEVKFRRICLVVFPNEVKQSLDGTLNNGRGVGLLGMKFGQCGNDFQAHVAWVQRGSRAERMGVRKGDVVSFAVALSNMTEENNSFLAEKLIKRLESVGMRTSYRELYDIFLSKTTNGRPIGMVFRRWKSRHSPQNVSSPTSIGNNLRITNEFEWSTDFLQSLSIKCREYEFEQKVPLSLDDHADTRTGKVKANDSRLSTFLPRPNVDTTPSNGVVADYLSGLMDSLAVKYNCATSLPMMKCIESTLGVNPQSTSDLREQAKKEDFLSNRTLCSLVEQSMGLIFLRRVADADRKVTGSGFAVVRRAEGSWSAPCFLSVLGSKDQFTDATDDSLSDDVKMIVIRKKELVNNLILGNAVKFTVRKDERANVLVRDAAVIGVQEGRFQLTSDFFLATKVNDVQNQGAYSLSTDQIEASDILTGTISPPEQSVDFYGALQSLELPYSMHSHPVIPDTLQRYSDSDWVEFLPDHESTAESSCGMRTKLQMIAQRNSSAEDRREIDIFARKFKYYLMDGVPVHRVLPSSGNGNGHRAGPTEEKVLRLTIRDPKSLFTSSLELTRRRRPGVSNVGIPSNFATTFESVTKLSRRPPAGLANDLDEEERKRFFSIETDLSPGPVMMLAKSKKDAMILLCGLKLLLEREKMLSY